MSFLTVVMSQDVGHGLPCGLVIVYVLIVCIPCGLVIVYVLIVCIVHARVLIHVHMHCMYTRCRLG